MNFTSARGIFFVVLFLYLLLQLYLFHRVTGWLRNRVENPRRRLLSGLVVFVFLFMLSPLAWRLLFGWGPNQPHPTMVRTLFYIFGIWGLGSTGCALVLLSFEMLRRLMNRFGRISAVDLGRRHFLKRGATVLAAAPFFVSGYGATVGRRRFEVEEFELPVSGLSSSLSQFSVVQLTDIHVGPFMPAEALAAYVEAVNRLGPDMIALTGDFVSSSASEVGPCVQVLSHLKARYGVFACMGNHDVYAGVEEEMTRLFAEKGIRVLRNDAASLRVGNATLSILGIDDLNWGRPDLSRALRNAGSEAGEARLLLSHRPEIFPAAAQKGIEVVLSGHYHGGQVKLASGPKSFSIARLITPYAEGLFHLSRRHQVAPSAKDSVLFVSRGIGITGLPIRINCPPQIAHLTLRKA